MKIRFYLALAAAALVMTNCSQDEELVQVKQNTKGFTATIEGASRSDVTEQGAFSWTAGDAISVYTEAGTFDTYANSEGNESTFVFSPEGDEEAGTPTGYAIYPAGTHSISGQNVSINLPANYDYGSTNAPMLATITEGSSTLAFKHLGGMMRFVVNNVPAEASSFVFTTTDNIITGNYSVIDEQIWQNGEGVADNTNNNVTINFDAVDIKESMVFFVPLPVGTYGNYTVAIKGTNVDLSHSSTGVTNTIGRCAMLLMPEFTCTDSGLEKASPAVIPVTGDDVDLSGIQNVTIGTDNADQEDVLNMNYTPQEGNAILNITDDSGETESQDSKGKINIIPTDAETPIESLNLNTPSLTAELGAGKYGTVEALTAKQTLIIGEGVTITKLILNGGALQVAEGATIGEIIVKDELGLRSAVAAGGKVTLQNDINLTGFDKWLSIENNCEIALGNYSITHDSSTVIKIFAGGELTIGGTGTVETKDAACGAIGNYGGTLIINDGTYKSIKAAAIYCDRSTETADDKRTGTWNLEINGGSFKTTNQTAVALQNNRANEGKTGYTAGLAQINSGTFEGGGGYHDLYFANVIINIDTEKCTFKNNKVKLQTKGGKIDGGTGTWGSIINGQEVTLTNADGMYLFPAQPTTEEELRAAVAAGGKVTLQNNIALTGYDKCLSINNDCEIDLNGKSITHTQSTVIKIFAGGELTIGGTGTVETKDAACGAIGNYGGTLIINGGTYNSIGTAAIYCDRGKGTTWNLTIEDGTFIATNGTAVSLQNNNGESTERQGLATIKKGTFTGAASWHDLYLCNVIADITASNCTFTKNKGIWLQTVENNTSDNKTETFSSVINGTPYDKVSEGVANGYITITDK